MKLIKKSILAITAITLSFVMAGCSSIFEGNSSQVSESEVKSPVKDGISIHKATYTVYESTNIDGDGNRTAGTVTEYGETCFVDEWDNSTKTSKIKVKQFFISFLIFGNLVQHGVMEKKEIKLFLIQI